MVPEYIFKHDDGVVNQHTGPQCESTQGHDIQGQVSEIHQGKSGYDGYGDGCTDNGCGTYPAQEYKKHKYSQYNTAYGAVPDFPDGTRDKLTLVLNNGKCEAWYEDLPLP
jgi:hypothetical protein